MLNSKDGPLIFDFSVHSLLIIPDSRWQTANQTAAQRQTELETCVDRLGSFASAASQLGPWLREKELMMSVLGPLSIDPNMLNTQRQQVQVRSSNSVPGQDIYVYITFRFCAIQKRVE